MKILSIDVGIKNLAYCLFFLNDTDKFDIDSWDVINIGPDEKIPTCCFIKKNKGGVCTNTSKLFKGSEYYCKVHSKHSDYIVPSATYNYKNIKNAKLFTLKQFCINNTIAIEHCKKKCDFLEAIRDFFAERVLSPIQKKNLNKLKKKPQSLKILLWLKKTQVLAKKLNFT